MMLEVRSGHDIADQAVQVPGLASERNVVMQSESSERMEEEKKDLQASAGNSRLMHVEIDDTSR